MIFYRILQCISQSFLFLQVLLVVSGWLIVKNKLKSTVRVVIAGLYTIYLILGMFNIVVDYSFYNPAVNTQPYSNAFGISITIYRSVVSIFVVAQGIYHTAFYRSRKRLYVVITLISSLWLNTMGVLKLILFGNTGIISVCSIQSLLDCGEHIADHILILFLLTLWVPSKNNLKRLNRFDSVSKAHAFLVCSVNKNYEKKKKLSVNLRIAERDLFLTKTLSILNHFDIDLKSVIEKNNAFIEIFEYDSNGENSMDDEDIDINAGDEGMLSLHDGQNRNIDDDGWIEQKLE
jgi:hypothetical protein